MAASPPSQPTQLRPCHCAWNGGGSELGRRWPLQWPLQGPGTVPAAQPLLGGIGVPVRVGLCVERPAVPLRWFFRAGLGLLLFVWLWWVLVC